MKRKNALITAGVAVALILGGGGYAAYDYFAGNHVEVKSVIAEASSENAGAAVSADEVNGLWNIDPSSEVYFSVTTSKETVNFAISQVAGSWTIDTSDISKTKGQGTVNLDLLDSGNGQRDSHIKGADYLNVAESAEATFTADSFEELPAEWTEGQAFPISMTGTLTIRGIAKEVTFNGEAVYSGGAINMESSAVVTFEDFGMKNPHTVVLDTENNVVVQLRLTLNPEQQA